MSDDEFDEESFRAYENELYGEKSSDSEEGIDSEIEEALYSQVHYSFSLPTEEDLDEDVGADSCSDSQTLLDSKQHDEKEVQDDDDDDDDSEKKIDYIVIDDESCSSIEISSGNNSNQEGNDDDNNDDDDDDNNDDDDDDDDNNSSKGTKSTQENWILIKEDLETDLIADGKRRPVSRYYKKEGNLRCHNCNEKGHKAIDCPTPKKICCFLCGGEHIRRRCPNELCFNCREPGHRVMNCKKPRSRPDDQCHRCFMLGHHSKDCPDRWRQYHRTTDANRRPVVNRSGEFTGPVYCYNCAEQGHYGHECIHDRMDDYLIPAYPFVVKYDGDPEYHQGNHILQDRGRKRTKTHDGTVGKFQGEVSGRANKRQKRKDERRSWPNQSHSLNESRRIEETEEGGTKTQDGRVQYIERIGERAKKRQRRKDKRNTWSGQSQDHKQSSRSHDIDQDIVIHIPNPHDRRGSSGNFENANQAKIGSKRRQSGTPYHGESKKGKQTEHKMNKQKKKKTKDKESSSASHNERIVELIHDDDIYSNDYQSLQHKTIHSKFNKRRESLPDRFTRMVEDRERNYSSPGYAHSKSHSSPAYNRRQSQGSSHHRQNKTFKDDRRWSREYTTFNSSRGFRSKWN